MSDPLLKQEHGSAAFTETAPMPVIFIGHGSPMNAIEENEFSDAWISLGERLPKPRAILCISAHWETKGAQLTANDHPKTIHDFYGFPQKLYMQRYPAPGSPELTDFIIQQMNTRQIEKSNEWGLDHGTWSVLKYIYPQADIPVVQFSIDRYKNAEWHYEMGTMLSFLRKRGVLVIGSGNMIHNLRMIHIPGEDFNAEHGYDWANELNTIFKQKIEGNDIQSLIAYKTLHKEVHYAIPTAEHYLPLLYVLGMRSGSDRVTIFNDKVIAGSLSMTSVLLEDENGKV